MNIYGERRLREQRKKQQADTTARSATSSNQESDTSSSEKPPKKKLNGTRTGVWGDPRTKAGKKRFREYLKNLTSADVFLKNERSVHFLKTLGDRTRSAIYKRLREVDPEGFKKVVSRLNSLGQQLYHSHHADVALDLKADKIVLEQEIDCAGSPKLLKLLPIGGLKNILSLCVAAGYTRDEVASMANMSILEFNAMVTKEDVRAASKDMPNAITHLANGMVLRDLMNGVVTPMTKEADMIVSRRSKVAVEVSKETRERTKFTEDMEKRREEELAKRFGVDRMKGEVIDASNKS